MDGLSGAAGAFAVVSLLIQITENVKKIHNFWKSIENAPALVSEYIDDLKYLQSLLAEIGDYEANIGDGALLAPILDSWNKKLASINSVLEGFKVGFDSTSRRKRKWSSVRAAIKTDDLQSFRAALDSLKATLLLAQHLHTSRMTKSLVMQQNVLLETVQRIETFQQTRSSPLMTTSNRSVLQTYQRDTGTHETTLLNLQHVAPITNSTLDIRQASSKQSWLQRSSQWRDLSLPPLFQAKTQQFKQICADQDYSNDEEIYIDEDDCTEFTRLLIFPGELLKFFGLRRGFDISMQQSQHGWKANFRSFNSVPADALIFKFSRDGNVGGIRQLLCDRQASVWDTDPRGRTPLHLAAKYARFEACQALIEAGGSLEARNYDTAYVPNKTPAMACAESNADPESKIRVLRLLSRHIDFSDDQGDGWDILGALLHASSTLYYSVPKSGPLPISWFMSLFLSDIRESPSFVEALKDRLFITDLREINELILQIDSRVIELSLNGNNLRAPAIHCVLSTPVYDPDKKLGMIKLFIELGADLHILASSSTCARYARWLGRQTPTLIATRYSHLFALWRQALRETHVNFDSFIEKELESLEILGMDWNKSSLTSLFNLEYEPLVPRTVAFYDLCKAPNCGGIPMLAEPWWDRTLEMVRSGQQIPTNLYISQENETWHSPGVWRRTADEVIFDTPSPSESKFFVWPKYCLSCLQEMANEQADEEDADGDSMFLPSF